VLNVYQFLERLRTRAFTTICRRGFHAIGSGSVVVPPLRSGGERHIFIGENVYIGSDSWLQVFVLKSAPQQTPVIKIGDDTSIAGYCTVTAISEVTIESKVLIARYAYISDHSHVHNSRDLPIIDQGLSDPSPVRICEGAWLGQNVVICPGVTIGRNAVIGANSVVRRSIPDFCVAAGAPAKVIRKVDRQFGANSMADATRNA
jgi:acetyltransferase-like isoleucine patch superfamily enzyme